MLQHVHIHDFHRAMRRFAFGLQRQEVVVDLLHGLMVDTSLVTSVLKDRQNRLDRRL